MHVISTEIQCPSCETKLPKFEAALKKNGNCILRKCRGCVDRDCVNFLIITFANKKIDKYRVDVCEKRLGRRKIEIPAYIYDHSLKCPSCQIEYPFHQIMLEDKQTRVFKCSECNNRFAVTCWEGNREAVPNVYGHLLLS